MKRILLLLCTLVFSTTGAVSQSPEPSAGPGPRPKLEWRRYTVKNEEFSVTLPTLPAMTTTAEFKARLGKHRLERHLQTSLEGVVYSIDAFENPEPKQTLEAFIAEQNETLDLTTERNLTIDGISGKEYSSVVKSLPVATVQFFATERRFYRFAASGAGAEHPGVKQFFSSIRLGKDQEGLAVSDGPGNPLEVGGERMYTGRELDAKPRLSSKPEPQYTEEARSNRTSGVVILRAVFSRTGEVTNIRVIKGLPDGLTERAIEAAKQIKFVPGMKDGHYVSMWMQLEYHFNP